MRGVKLPSGQSIILADTVGFISDLPTHLVAAFRATLEEVVQADVVLHVRDVSHPDTEAQRSDVLTVLADLGIEEGSGRLAEVLNKIDQLPDAARLIALNQTARRQDAVAISALTGEGLDRLSQLIDGRVTSERQVVQLDIDLSDGAALASLYRSGEVLERWDDDEHAHVRVAIASAELARFENAHPYRPVERVRQAS
jgi:GTP-binding protein HflX